MFGSIGSIGPVERLLRWALQPVLEDLDQLKLAVGLRRGFLSLEKLRLKKLHPLLITERSQIGGIEVAVSWAGVLRGKFVTVRVSDVDVVVGSSPVEGDPAAGSRAEGGDEPTRISSSNNANASPPGGPGGPGDPPVSASTSSKTPPTGKKASDPSAMLKRVLRYVDVEIQNLCVQTADGSVELRIGWFRFGEPAAKALDHVPEHRKMGTTPVVGQQGGVSTVQSVADGHVSTEEVFSMERVGVRVDGSSVFALDFRIAVDLADFTSVSVDVEMSSSLSTISSARTTGEHDEQLGPGRRTGVWSVRRSQLRTLMRVSREITQAAASPPSSSDPRLGGCSSAAGGLGDEDQHLRTEEQKPGAVAAVPAEGCSVVAPAAAGASSSPETSNLGVLPPTDDEDFFDFDDVDEGDLSVAGTGGVSTTASGAGPSASPGAFGLSTITLRTAPFVLRCLPERSSVVCDRKNFLAEKFRLPELLDEEVRPILDFRFSSLVAERTAERQSLRIFGLSAFVQGLPLMESGVADGGGGELELSSWTERDLFDMWSG